jgi:hypothetical protein
MRGTARGIVRGVAEERVVAGYGRAGLGFSDLYLEPGQGAT